MAPAPAPTPTDPRRAMVLTQCVISTVLAVAAFWVLRGTDSERGPMFWLLLFVAVTSTGQALWFGSRYLRLRDRPTTTPH